jgi:hypothetical protein
MDEGSSTQRSTKTDRYQRSSYFLNFAPWLRFDDHYDQLKNKLQYAMFLYFYTLLPIVIAITTSIMENMKARGISYGDSSANMF